MKFIKTSLIVCSLLGVVVLTSFFHKRSSSVKEVSDTTKYVYAVMIEWYDPVALSALVIEYSNGKTEDFLKIEGVKNSDFKAYRNRYVMSAFKYMNAKGFELQTGMSDVKGNREYYFVRKKVE